MPELIGGWPPTSDDGAKRGLIYEALMLLLFNSWRNIRRLREGHGTFAEVFADFESMMSNEVRAYVQVENIQALYGGDSEDVEPWAMGRHYLGKIG